MLKLFCAILVTMLLTCCSCSRSTDFRDQVVSLFDAINRRDVAAEMSYFADDVTYIISGDPPYIGKAAVRPLLEWDSVLMTTVDIGGLSVSGDTVTVDSWVENSEWFRLIGVPGTRSLPGSRFVFEKGLIKTVELSGQVSEDAKALAVHFRAFMIWFVNTHRDRVNEVRDKTFFRFSAQRAADWMQLAGEWREWKTSRGMLN